MARDVFDVREQIGDVAARRLACGVQRQAAVADQHGRHAVQRIGIERGIPEDLRIGVRVGVDEAGHHERAVGVEGGLTVVSYAVADLDDAAGMHPHVGSLRRGASAVDDIAAANQ